MLIFIKAIYFQNNIPQMYLLSIGMTLTTYILFENMQLIETDCRCEPGILQYFQWGFWKHHLSLLTFEFLSVIFFFNSSPLWIVFL